MDLSRTASILWTLFSSHVGQEDLVWVICMGGGMRETHNRVLWAGGTASLVMAAVWERVFRCICGE